MRLLIVLSLILFTGCQDKQVDNMVLAKLNILCKDHKSAKQIYNQGRDNYLLCKDGFIIKNYDLDSVYGQEVYDEYIRLEEETKKEVKNESRTNN